MKKTTVLTLWVMFYSLCFSVDAQQPAKVARIGYLHNGAKPDGTDEVFQRGLRELGYMDGKNIVVEYRYAEGKAERFDQFAAELVRSSVDLIIAVNEAGARAAKKATQSIPIIMVRVGRDPVEAGLVDSLARPGGNLTGLTVMATELTGKRLEMFKDTVPRISRVDALYDPRVPGNVEEAKAVQSTGRILGLNSKSWEIRSADDVEKVSAVLRKDGPIGLYVPGGTTLASLRNLIVKLTLKGRIPSVYTRKEPVEAGGLMSYGVDPVDDYRRVVYFVDKILKGTKPEDLPVERPKMFEFVVNLKTAKQVGLTIPPNMLARADRVIR